jgi:hypothetical protein
MNLLGWILLLDLELKFSRRIQALEEKLLCTNKHVEELNDYDNSSSSVLSEYD